MGKQQLQLIAQAIRLVLKAREDNAVLRTEQCDQKLHEVDTLLRELLRSHD